MRDFWFSILFACIAVLGGTALLLAIGYFLVGPEVPKALAQSFYSISVASNQGTSGAQHAVNIAGPQYVFFINCSGATAATLSPASKCLLIDSATVPADGAIMPIICVDIPASPATSSTNGNPPSQIVQFPLPVQVKTGAVVVYSSGANCSTKTTSVGDNVSVSLGFN